MKQSATQRMDITAHSLYPDASEVVMAPFGYMPNGFGSDRVPDVDTGYYLGLLNAFTKNAIDRKLAELLEYAGRDLLLPAQFTDQCNVNPDTERSTIRILFAYPFIGRPRHEIDTWKPLCRYIQQSYTMKEDGRRQNAAYSLWRRR